MKVSIIIPVYNRQELIKETLDSVLAQTYQNWECIVVDDGSTDNTWQVLQEYAAKDERIKVFQRNREPKGAPTCRNIGAELSQTEYLIFWDSDDIMAPWCVEERVNFMNENQELDFGLFQLLNITENNEYSLRCFIGEDDYLKRFLTFESAWGTHAVIWSRSFFELLEGWNENAKIWQDGEIHIRALLENPIFKWGSEIPDGIVRFGIDSNSISTVSNEFINLYNRLGIVSEIHPLLKPKYKQILTFGVLARIYFKTYNFTRKDKFTIINYAFEKGLLSNSRRWEFCLIFNLYFYVNRIPLLKGLFYRVFIRPKFKNHEFWYRGIMDNSVKEEFLKKTDTLKKNSGFRKRIDLIFN